jgi:hypothetical protein
MSRWRGAAWGHCWTFIRTIDELCRICKRKYKQTGISDQVGQAQARER